MTSDYFDQHCPYCYELVADNDQSERRLMIMADGVAMMRVWHYECFARGAIGSVAHIMEKCSCFGGDPDANEDPPDLTRREAAKLGLALVRAKLAIVEGTPKGEA